MTEPLIAAPVSACFFVADLHLDGSAKGAIGLRRLLCATREANAALFILGDMFHYWFGRKHLRVPMYRNELALLAEATALGTPIRLVPGNRDFLVDKAFARATGVEVLADYHALRLGGDRIHLSHGDLFCTRDVGYQRLRRVLHSKMVVFSAHHLPAWIVHPIARRLRRHSQRTVGNKRAEDLEPDLEAVEALFDEGFSVVICGHFHRQRCVESRRALNPSDAQAERFLILEPYEEHGYVLSWNNGEWRHRRLAEKEDA